MAGDHFKKVKSGDKLVIPALAFNSFVDAARDYQERQRAQTADPTPSPRNMVIVPVRNDTGGDLERFNVVGLDVPIIDSAANLDEFRNRATFAGVTPAIPDHRGRFGILLEPITSGAIGAVCLMGILPARINVDDARHLRADIEHGSTTLKSGHHGAVEILWKESGEGLKWALLKHGVGEPLSITFIVKLVQVEGEAGVNGGADCTYAYDVYDLLSDEKLNKDDVPRAPIVTNIRPSATQMTAATRGSAYWTVKDNQIVIELEEAFEAPTPRKVLDVVTAIECEPISPGLAGDMDPDCCKIQLTYYTTRVYFPAGTRFEAGPQHTIICECCGDSSSGSGSSPGETGSGF
jgi:hypothetical protein